MTQIKTEKTEPESESSGNLPETNKTILVVDDDPTIRKLLKGMLKDHFNVIEAGNGTECLKKLSANPAIDLGLIDIEMPNINGIQLVKMIRKQDAYTDLPIMMVTVTSDKDHVVQSIHAGAKDYIVKPFSKQTILEKICKYLNMEIKELSVFGTNQ